MKKINEIKNIVKMLNIWANITLSIKDSLDGQERALKYKGRNKKERELLDIEWIVQRYKKNPNLNLFNINFL